MRVDSGVERGERFDILIDGRPVAVFAGETLATALIEAGLLALRRDSRGSDRGLYCNMGVCCECMVRVEPSGGRPRRVRACLTPVARGLRVSTGIDRE